MHSINGNTTQIPPVNPNESGSDYLQRTHDIRQAEITASKKPQITTSNSNKENENVLNSQSLLSGPKSESPKPKKRKKRGRKCKSADGRTLREIAKTASNSGKAFTNHKGSKIKEKAAKPDVCKSKTCGCHKFTLEQRIQINKEHYSKNVIAQDEALRRLKTLVPINHKRRVAKHRNEIKKERRESGLVEEGNFPAAKKSRSHSTKYHIVHPVEKVPVLVCRLSVEAIFGVSDKKLRRIHKKPEAEQRGIKTFKTGLKSSKGDHTIRDHNFVKQHINSFHYEYHHYDSRTTMLFLYDPHIRSVPDMYKDYQYQVQNQNDPPPGQPRIKEYCFQQYSTTVHDLNINFPDNKTDVCGVCVYYKNNNLTDSPECQRHRFYARQAQLARKVDQKFASDNPDVFFVELDAKSVSTVPQIDAGPAHYLRNLNCNMIIAVDLATQDTQTFVWSEYEGNKGVNELITVQKKLLTDLKLKRGGKPIKKFLQWSYKCGGQNLSQYNMAADAAMVELGLADEIEKNFFVSGHSFMSPDQRSITINKTIKAESKIETPADLHKITENPFQNIKYTQHKLKTSDFVDFKSSIDEKTKILGRTAKIEGEPTRKTEKIQFKRIQRYKSCKPDPYKIRYKYTRQKLDKDDKEPWKILDISKTPGSKQLFTDQNLSETLYPDNCIPLKMKKYNHLQKYSPYLSESAKNFYQNLPYDDSQGSELIKGGDKIVENTKQDSDFL